MYWAGKWGGTNVPPTPPSPKFCRLCICTAYERYIPVHCPLRVICWHSNRFSVYMHILNPGSVWSTKRVTSTCIAPYLPIVCWIAATYEHPYIRTLLYTHCPSTPFSLARTEVATGRSEVPYDNLQSLGVQVYGMPPGIPFHSPLLYNQQQLQQILANLEKITFLKLGPQLSQVHVRLVQREGTHFDKPHFY